MTAKEALIEWALTLPDEEAEKWQPRIREEFKAEEETLIQEGNKIEPSESKMPEEVGELLGSWKMDEEEANELIRKIYESRTSPTGFSNHEA